MARPILLALLGVSAALAACQPQDRRPGLWLSGEVVEGPVEDWSFTDAHPEIFVETRAPWLVPHSVTTVVAATDDAVYVPSLFRGEEGWPEGKRWTRNVVRDPRVRLGIGGRLYPRRAVLVTDPAERERAFAAFAAKYPFWRELREAPPEERPELVFLRMEPREAS